MNSDAGPEEENLSSNLLQNSERMDSANLLSASIHPSSSSVFPNAYYWHIFVLRTNISMYLYTTRALILIPSRKKLLLLIKDEQITRQKSSSSINKRPFGLGGITYHTSRSSSMSEGYASLGE